MTMIQLCTILAMALEWKLMAEDWLLLCLRINLGGKLANVTASAQLMSIKLINCTIVMQLGEENCTTAVKLYKEVCTVSQLDTLQLECSFLSSIRKACGF